MIKFKNIILFIITLLSCFNYGIAQINEIPDAKLICKGSKIITEDLFGIFDPTVVQPWQTILTSNTAPEENPDIEKLLEIRKAFLKQNPKNDYGIDLNNSFKTNGLPNAYIQSDFEGCTFDGGSPSDNTIAVSKAGYIVASANSTVKIYDPSNVKVREYTLSAFAKDANLLKTFDPKVLYDFVSDRFILVFLNGDKAATSKVIIAFSTTSNPTDKWNVYKLPGNVNNTGVWFDFPNLGITQNDLYICGNMFTDNSVNKNAVIYQISKHNGYNGAAKLKYKIYDTLETNFQDPLFSLFPVSHGQSEYGPGIYFVNSIKGGSNEIDISYITDSLNSGNAVFKCKQYYMNLNYEVPTSALMFGAPNAKNLYNNDCRILGALRLKNYIYFTFHGDIKGTGYSSLIVGRYNINTEKIDTTTLSSFQTSLAYPNIASIGFGEWDQTLAIVFLSSSKKEYPGSYYTVIDQNLKWADPLPLKKGDWYYNAQGSQNDERWGDYSGIATWNGNGCPSIVTHTSFPRKTFRNSTPFGDYANWCARLAFCNPSDIKEIQSELLPVNIFPNPASTDFSKIEFQIAKTEKINIEVYNSEGKLIKILHNDYIEKGKYSLYIETFSLTNGNYIIKINSQSKNYQSINLIVNH